MVPPAGGTSPTVPGSGGSWWNAFLWIGTIVIVVPAGVMLAAATGSGAGVVIVAGLLAAYKLCEKYDL